jgi:ubiquinone/menaquinone biosynthesis C-methylase UbiE
MPSLFNARDAANYDRLMGRWSRLLAPLFIAHAGLGAGEDILEVGCGTGSLTFVLPQMADIKSLVAIDHSAVYLAAAQAKNRDRRIRLEEGDAAALRFPDASFDRALSMLVLPAVLPDAETAVAEMRRVTRPGGLVCAAFWDSPGGGVAQRMFWDTAAALDKEAGLARDRTMARSVYVPGALPQIWAQAGLVEIDARDLLIRMDFADFDDYWGPYASGEGMLGAYVASLGEERRARLVEHLRSAFLCGRPEGPRSFAAIARSCRGVVPGRGTRQPTP